MYTVHVYVFIREKKEKNPCIDNLRKIGVDTQYLYTDTTKSKIVDTHEHNSYICMCFI